METLDGVENLLDNMRMYFKPIEVFRGGTIVDDFVCDFEPQPGEEIKEYEPLRDAMLLAIPRAGALRGGVLYIENRQERALPKWWRPRMKMTKEQVLEQNEASDDELEVKYQEAAAIMTIAKQRRAEVDRARQFFRKTQSSEDRKARLDKLKQKFQCAKCGQLGHWKDDNECPAKVKVVHWEETEEQATEEPWLELVGLRSLKLS